MKKDVFIEHMIKQKKTKKQIMIRVLTVFGAVIMAVFPILLMMVIPENFLPSFPLSIAAAIWLSRVIFRHTTYEFEYIITNGEMDVDRIAGKNSRKRILTVNCKSFDILAPYKEAYAAEYNSKTIAKRIDASKSPKSPGRYFAVFNDKNGLRTLLIFEPNERMMEVFRIYIARKIKG